jgi:hypothetical protein
MSHIAYEFEVELALALLPHGELDRDLPHRADMALDGTAGLLGTHLTRVE